MDRVRFSMPPRFSLNIYITDSNGNDNRDWHAQDPNYAGPPATPDFIVQYDNTYWRIDRRLLSGRSHYFALMLQNNGPVSGRCCYLTVRETSRSTDATNRRSLEATLSSPSSTARVGFLERLFNTSFLAVSSAPRFAFQVQPSPAVHKVLARYQR